MISRRLRVSRTVTREAKAYLCGKGILVQDRLGMRVGGGRASLLVFEQWLGTTPQPNGPAVARRLRDVLSLRRLIWPEAASLALRRATPEQVEQLVERHDDLLFFIATRGTQEQLENSQRTLLLHCAERSGSPMLSMLTSAFAEAAAPLPLWWYFVEDRERWTVMLEESKDLLRKRKPLLLRTALRRHLRVLDRNLCGLIARSR